MSNITLDGLPLKTGTVSDAGIVHYRESGVDKKLTISDLIAKFLANNPKLSSIEALSTIANLLSLAGLNGSADKSFHFDGVGSLVLADRLGTTTNKGIAFLSNPITISNNATDTNNDIDFSAGNFQFSDGSGQAVATAIMTKRLDAPWSAGTGNGGLFSGTKAINTWYYPFKIYNPTTGVEDAGFDISSSGANIPSGFTKRSNNFQPIKTDGSGNILQGTFYKDGGFFYATRQTEESANDASATGNLTLSFVPPILAYAICLAYAQSNALNAYPHYYAGLSANNLIFQTAQLSAGNTRANGYIPTSNSVIYRQYGGDGNRTCTLFTNGFQLINFKI